ncbi:MAG: metal-dependent hydrolase, partial [Nitrospinaceae bacterium]|nr:metal-dependent hydrolase [Nitrospinaceae bacterium]NIR56773.1 metal-dependent hydrolase [Nitrospinaceae bacterium]NIS87224.1 metal-dependent hydrolase [Nitrospinaceae bacterium]NIT84094.1 metal-dependent hydrolase [Nitrospinaceae bacterium]NIU46273.1 metal-dependent hydrolase [Nitrospinaceae bacterium]
DTAYFLDMKVIGEVHRPDLALINIGGHFGMEPSLAARAAKTVDAKIAVPHHFATFPVLTQSAQGFAEALQGSGVKFVEMQPGSSLTFEGRELAD